MVRTLSHLIGLDPGFGSVGVVSADIDLQGTAHDGAVEQGAFLDEVLGRISAQPGVEAAGAVYPLPIHGRRVSATVWVEHRPDTGRPAMVELRFVTPGYLEAMAIPLTDGRALGAADGAEGPDVAVVNKSFVRQFLERGSALGQRITIGRLEGSQAPRWITIVGVVGDVRHVDLATPAGPEMYVPLSQHGFPWASIVVRAPRTSASVLTSLRTVVHGVDANVPVFNLQTMQGVVSDSLSGRRFAMVVLSVFGGAALLMAVIGIYGVISYRTAQRTREIGVRMALGATPSSVLRLVIGTNMAPVAVGVVAGVLIAGVASQAVRGLLAGVGPTDPTTFAIVAIGLLTAAGCASAGPARRIVHIDPAETLRDS
jgi:putative ABC transport system permease protein